MGDPRARSERGDVEGDDGDAVFGELEWEAPAGSDPALPDSSARPNAHTRKTIRREDGNEDAGGEGEADASASQVSPKKDRLAEMRELYARGDADAALAIANKMDAVTLPPPAIRERASSSGDHPDASIWIEMEQAEVDEAELEEPGPGVLPVLDADDLVDERDMTRIAKSATLPPAPALTSLTARQGIPRLLLGQAEVSKLPIDHRAGFLLGFIDGMQTMEEILDVCAMPPGEALELIRSLVDMGVIVIE